MKKEVKKVVKENEEKDSLLNEIKIKSQAAMEYLMTYGWAILIIALTLAVLYSLGIMNPKNFLPRAPPGSCFVFRPNGPRTTDFVSLQGTCGYLPMYVGSFNGVPIEGIKIPLRTTNFTISVWFYNGNPAGTYYGCNPSRSCSTPILDIYNASTNNGVGGGQNFDFAGIGASDGTSVVYGGYWPYSEQNYRTPIGSVSPSTWVNVIVSVYNYNTVNVTVNGRTYSTTFSASASTALNSLVTPALSLSSNPPGADEISSKILIANVQIYSTTLTPKEVQYLYQQGLGGGPIRLGSLVGWWPLNGDAKDYSGNNLHGTISGGVTFVQNYNPP